MTTAPSRVTPQTVDDENLPVLRHSMRLAFVELHHPNLHGSFQLNIGDADDDDEYSEPCPETGQYLVEWIPTDDEIECGRLPELTCWMALHPRPETHPFIRGYSRWVNHVNQYGTLEIVKTFYHSSTGALFAVLYTYLIRRIQRRWRKFLVRRRKNALKSVSMHRWHNRLIYGAHPMALGE
jgi:hypothetical protein